VESGKTESRERKTAIAVIAMTGISKNGERSHCDNEKYPK